MSHCTIPLALVIALIAITGCATDPTKSEEYSTLVNSVVSLDAELASAQEQLLEVTAERDVLAAAAATSALRHEKATRTHNEIIALLHNPEAFGTEEEVADLLATHATADAMMDDDVFGAVQYRQGFYNTLYSGTMDARIDVFYDWLSEDGTQGGFLWRWHGTNAAGNSFSLAGISVTTHDDAGLISHEFVTYPYADDYVRQAVFGEGT